MILFINGSHHPNGKTAALAKTLLDGQTYETLNLVDYKISVYGQNLPDDQFDKVLEKIRAADVLVIGSPMYWHNLCGSVRTMLDRFHGYVKRGSLSGKLFFIFQGAAPEKWMMEATEYTIIRFAKLYGYTYEGMISTQEEAAAAAAKVL